MKYYKVKQNDALQYINLQQPFENCHVISNVVLPFHFLPAVHEGLKSSTAFSLIKALRVDQ